MDPMSILVTILVLAGVLFLIQKFGGCCGIRKSQDNLDKKDKDNCGCGHKH